VLITNSAIISERSSDTTQRRISKDNSAEESLWRRAGGGDREMVPEMLKAEVEVRRGRPKR
jgi:hypothetical protein